MSKFLSAFRKGYSCEAIFIKLIDDWRKCSSEHNIIAAMLIDWSKALDCLPHRLLLAKLNAYGLSIDSCNMLMSYLSERKQRVKMGNSRSSGSEIIKGVPQGSTLDPLLCNVFINDIFYAIENVYNYADNNVLSCSGDSLHEIAASLLRIMHPCGVMKYASHSILGVSSPIYIDSLEICSKGVCMTHLNNHTIFSNAQAGVAFEL